MTHKIKEEYINELKRFCDFCDILYDFDPEEYFTRGGDYYKTRAELVKLEKKYYITYEFIDSVFIIYYKRFIVWDDTIDEEDSSWVEERVVFSMEFNIEYTPAREMIDNVIDKCRDLGV